MIHCQMCAEALTRVSTASILISRRFPKAILGYNCYKHDIVNGIEYARSRYGQSIG